MNNERGGILANLFIVPAGIALVLGAFLLGYYVGRTQNAPGGNEQMLPPLPDVVSKNLPKPEEFTFYKTLTEKENKTVSIEIKPKQPASEMKAEKKQEEAKPKEAKPKENENQQVVSKPREGKAEQKLVAQTSALRAAPAQQKKETSPKQTAAKLRYVLQVSSYQEKSPADEEVKRLKQNGFAAHLIASDLSGKGKWYRVRVGSFADKASAEKLQGLVREKTGLSAIIVLE